MNILLLKPTYNQVNLHFEKSISGCYYINPFNISYFLSSSDEGNPAYFYLISNIIFSTVGFISSSKSEIFDASGLIFEVLILVCPLRTQSHHDIVFGHLIILISKIFLSL